MTFCNLIKQQFQENKIGWIKSYESGFCQDENSNYLPWMCYPLIEFLKKNLTKNDLIFEYGSGASTLFFADKAQKVFAIESNKKWFEIMQIKIAELGLKNVELFLMEDALQNENYEKFAKNLGINFDFTIIDSLKRFKCTQNSINALNPMGKLILDDSERENYQKIYDFMKEKNFNFYDFSGIAPAQIKLKKGTVFYKN